MFRIRPARQEDLDDLYSLALEMAPGITTFPPDRQLLETKISKSIQAFDTDITEDQPRDFLLVLEDIERRLAIGTAGVYTSIGHDKPFYSFQIINQTQQSHDPDIRVTSSTLHLTNAFQGGTEVGTLLLHPDYKGKGLGKLLAKSRYLLIKMFPLLFNDPIFAELRGWSDEHHQSPFWNAVGRHFFGGLEFAQADILSATTNNQFISDLMPRYPIYIDLLPEECRTVIGKAHDKGQAALALLEEEGFRDLGYIDIFDAGATVVAKASDLDTVNNSHPHTVVLSDSIQQQDSEILIASGDLSDFQVVQTNLWSMQDYTLLLASEQLQSFHLKQSQEVYVYTLD